MTAFIDIIVNFYHNVMLLFDAVIFELSGYNVSFGDVLLVCIVFYMIISLYWRGAKG